jgi:hypothetical protein
MHELEALQIRRLGGSAPLARLDVDGWQPLSMLMPERLRAPHEVGFRRYLKTNEARVI